MHFKKTEGYVSHITTRRRTQTQEWAILVGTASNTIVVSFYKKKYQWCDAELGHSGYLDLFYIYFKSEYPWQFVCLKTSLELRMAGTFRFSQMNQRRLLRGFSVYPSKYGTNFLYLKEQPTCLVPSTNR
jgi:hypothetical protein